MNVWNRYAVLDLQPGVTESDIKVQYRKKSLLIHPDKTKNPAAPDAFDRLKKAHSTLMEEKSRTYLDECIADARRLLIREHKYTLDSPELKRRVGEDKPRLSYRRKVVKGVKKRRKLKKENESVIRIRHGRTVAMSVSAAGEIGRKGRRVKETRRRRRK